MVDATVMSGPSLSNAPRSPDDNWAHLVLAGWASVLFWVCLFACGGVYALVYLAPKLALHADLQRTERINHQRLLNWQRETARLQRLALACERDPAFARELARKEFDYRPAEEESIPVPPHLTLQINAGSPLPGENGEIRLPEEPWYGPFVRWLAGHPAVGNGVLWTAGLVTVLAFTFLQGPVTRAA
jgi:hypothetical protein